MAANTSSRRARRKSPTWWKWTKRTAAVLSLVVLIPTAVIGFLFFQQVGVAREKIASIGNLRDETTRQPSYIYASDGTELYHVSAEYRTWVPYEKIPKLVKNAILAAEDKRFFEHSGIDAIAIGRTLFTTVKSRSISQGGSTLTMQLAKLLYSNSERTFKRKLSDMAMAYTMEQNMTKEEIFEFYANKVYFGSGAFGVQAAAKVYFGKKLDDLTIGEAALLARLVRRPSDENPFRNAKKAIENRDVVLQIMLDGGMITQSEYEDAKAEKYSFKQRASSISEQFGQARYFVWHVLDVLHDEHPEIHLDQGGYKVYTTINLGLQRVAENAVRETVRDHTRDHVTTAAFVAIDSQGKILCEVGGVDFHRNQYNVVKDGLRQPGSSFKPFVYATAFATGAVNINDTLSNEPFTWEIPGGAPWRPKNSNGRSGGSVSLQTAFKMSMNIPAARVMQKTGPNTVLAYCRSAFGFTSPNLKGQPSMVLGSEEVTPLEMAQAYSVFMLRGNRAKPYCITRIIGPDGVDIPVSGPQITKNVIDPNVTDQIDFLMRSVVTSGTGTRAGIVPDARGKTGTTSENRDAWFCGYSDGIVGIGWIANEVPRKGRPASYLPMARSVFGGKVTVEFWAQIMKYAQAKLGHPMERPQYSVSSSKRSEDVPPDDPNDIPVDQDGNPIDPTQKANGPGQPATKPGEVPPGTGGTDPDKGPDTGPPSTLPPTTNPDKPPVKPPVEPPKENDEDYVTVEVCADTGMRASIYCPETVTRRFKKGTEPHKRCTKHGG